MQRIQVYRFTQFNRGGISQSLLLMCSCYLNLLSLSQMEYTIHSYTSTGAVLCELAIVLSSECSTEN